MDQNINQIVITCPEGCEIDYEHSTFECIKFKPIKPQLPKTWEEFCENTLVKNGESWIDEYGQINVNHVEGCKRYQRNKNILPSEDLAKAMLALCQLIQLRDCYNNGWEPDWCNTEQNKYCIISCGTKMVGMQITKAVYTTLSRILAFKSEELRDKFLENFKDLIEIVKPLL